MMKLTSESEFDVSIILNLHREAVYVFRTIRALSEAASYASRYGLRIELVIVFDRSDDATRQAVESAYKFGFARITSINVEHGSLGPSRNSGIALANGEYIWLADADDLMSFNCINEMHQLAQSGERIVVFPQYLIAFGTYWWIVKYFDDSFIETADFLYKQPYISRLFVRKVAFESVQFADLRLSQGFAYEDWLINCELRACGYRFLIAPKTLIFYRQRADSLVRQADMISVGQIPHSTLFEPEQFMLSRAAERAARNENEFLSLRAKARNSLPREEVLNDVTCMELVAAAVKIDPGIYRDEMHLGENSGFNIPPDPHWGQNYFNVCEHVGLEKRTDIVLVPWLSAGGGERYILDVLTTLQDLEPESNFLMISGEPHDNHNWLHKLPYNTVFLDLYGSFPCLTEDERDLLTLRTILAYSIKTRTRLHLKASDFANRIYNKFFHCLGSIKSIYYRFSDPRKIYNNDTFELGYSFDFISNHLANLWLLISDHERITSADRRRFGIQKCKWFTLYAKHETKQIRVGVEPRMRLLWASRLSPEKRLDVLMAIASEASRLLPGVVIEAFGTSTGDLNIREYFPENTSLIYKGAYIDFNELKPEDYDAFIYTTHYDGLPNVVLEAMSWGLPVIAPDVGGLQNAVMDGSTGYLLPDLQDNDEMATAYALAIQRLYQNWNATLDMGQTAQDLIWRRHRPEVYKKRLAQMLL
jgi:glycosyltransferase involved in cell wall biosynthesis